ncbi:MAG: hypothetical protein ICV73_27305 [Acetobacteraceae bacterium]|nr:hypothetical protein [Acetobacteraceae bacterium]
MMQRRSLLAAAAAAPLLGGAGDGTEGDVRAAMSPAQIALFETPHLASLRPPLRLDYAFRREEGGKEPVDDTIRLALRASAGGDCCDVSPEFLTGPRALPYPPARSFHGNPLLLFALDRDTRELSAATGGTPNWFRNRFRQALATAAEVRPAEVEHEGRRVPATLITLRPYEGEPRAGRYQHRLYAFALSEAVPGRIHSIRTELPAEGDAAAVVESIAFVGTSPLPEGAG